MSWVTCEPKSTIRILSCMAASRLAIWDCRGMWTTPSGRPWPSSRLPYEKGDKESVGVGAPRGHQEPLLGRQHRAAEEERTFAQCARDLTRRNDGKFRMSRKETAHLIAVLLRQYRAGDIGDTAANLRQ